jgi:hypothetical protein
MSGIVILLSFMIISCNKIEEDEQWGGGEFSKETVLSLSTYINNTYVSMPSFDEPASSRSAENNSISQFNAGQSIGIYGTGGEVGILYENKKEYANIKSTFDGDNWNMEKKLILHYDPVTLFAYYPYNDTIADGKAIPIDIKKQIDYMYGTHDKEQPKINVENPFVRIVMRHAMSQLQFNIKKDILTVPVRLTKIEIRGTGEKGIKTKGTYDCQTGKIQEEGDFGCISISDAGINIPYIYDERNIRRMIVMPTVIENTGDIKLVLTINGQEYEYAVPATTWRQGQRNIYNIIYRAGEVIVDSVSINTWQDGGDIILPDLTAD